MSGYKRVNFYELCRLCATNQQSEKTHIFQEEGRKIQLQTKIQSLLSLKVCEDDCLPKVVCSNCLQCLEQSYTFKNGCVTSESMLSSYFNTYQYKEDFTKTGKVYIKETSTKPEPVINTLVQNQEPELPPLFIPQEVKMKSPQNNQQPIYLNIKQRCQPSFTINANGELVNITPMIDFEGLVQQAKKTKAPTPKKVKQEIVVEEAVMNFNIPMPQHEKPCVKKEKSVFPVKVDVDAKNMNSIIVSPVSVPIRNVTVPPNVSQSYQSTQKIDFGGCYYTNQMGFAQVESVEVTPELNTISPNWTENITIPHQDPLQARGKSDLPKIFECEICKKTFKRREHLYQHVKLHTGFRPFNCEHCNKAFMRKEHLLRHMTSHSGLKNFTCNVCEKSFSRNDNLLKHKKTHDKESNFVCEICNKHFVMKHYYVAHKLTHDAENKGGSTVVWTTVKARCEGV